MQNGEGVMDGRHIKVQKNHGTLPWSWDGLLWAFSLTVINTAYFELFVVKRKCHYEVREKLTPVWSLK